MRSRTSNPGVFGTPLGAAQHLLTRALNCAISSLERFDLFSLGGAARLVTVSVGKSSSQASRAAVAARSSTLSSAAVVESFFCGGFWAVSGFGLVGCGLEDSGLEDSGLGDSGFGA